MIIDPDNKSTSYNPIGRFMVAGGGIIEYKKTGKILLIKRSDMLDWHPSEWEICYGRIAQFEDVEMGLRRELYEELGIKDLQIIKVLRVWHLFRGSKKAKNELIGITYHCRTTQENIKLSKEHSQYQWIAPEKALKIIQVDGIKKDLIQFINMI